MNNFYTGMQRSAIEMFLPLSAHFCTVLVAEKEVCKAACI